MVYQIFRRPLGIATAAIILFSGGCGVGMCIGRSCRTVALPDQTRTSPGLPIFGSEEASTVLSEKVNKGSVTNRVSEIMKYGYPGMDHIIFYSDFVISYNRRNRIPNWVFEHLTADDVSGRSYVDRTKCNFIPDKHIHQFFRADNSDYKNSGYDRGHLAAAGNHRKDQRHIEETFYLSNIAPQVGDGFNRGAWNRLERYIRNLAARHQHVYICTGPLFLPMIEQHRVYVKYEVIGDNFVAVPTHFFKVFLIESRDKSLHLEAYIMPNKQISDDVPLETFRVSLEGVERSAGLLFFNNIQRSRLSTINGKTNTCPGVTVKLSDKVMNITNLLQR